MVPLDRPRLAQRLASGGYAEPLPNHGAGVHRRAGTAVPRPPSPAWHRNIGKRLVRAPKIHVVDSGLDRDTGRGMARLAALCGDDFEAGILLYNGRDMLPLADDRMLAVPLGELWER